MRRLIRRGIERLMVTSGGARFVRRLRRDKDLILAYHNIVPTGEAAGGDRSLHLARRKFARQLDRLRTTHDIVSLDGLLNGTEDESIATAPRAAITFDDGYRGALTAGLRELTSRGISATFFVAPGLLGGHSFWWDELADPESGRVDPGFRRTAMIEDRGQAPSVYARATSMGLTVTSQPGHARTADEEHLVTAVEAPGIRIGSHSWSHPSLDRLDGEDLAGELQRSLQWLRERFGDRTSPWLSLPYGRTAPHVQDAAATAGYRGSLRIDGGLVPPCPDPMAVPRVNVPAGLSAEGFALRSAGLFT